MSPRSGRGLGPSHFIAPAGSAPGRILRMPEGGASRPPGGRRSPFVLELPEIRACEESGSALRIWAGTVYSWQTPEQSVAR